MIEIFSSFSYDIIPDLFKVLASSWGVYIGTLVMPIAFFGVVVLIIALLFTFSLFNSLLFEKKRKYVLVLAGLVFMLLIAHGIHWYLLLDINQSVFSTKIATVILGAECVAFILASATVLVVRAPASLHFVGVTFLTGLLGIGGIVFTLMLIHTHTMATVLIMGAELITLIGFSAYTVLIHMLVETSMYVETKEGVHIVAASNS